MSLWEGVALEADEVEIIQMSANPGISWNDIPKKPGERQRLQCSKTETQGGINFGKLQFAKLFSIFATQKSGN